MDEPFDLVEAVGELRRELDAAGEADWSRILNDALTGSCVPGEFLGETREQLRRLRRTREAKLLGLRPRIDTAIKHLNAALGGRWRA